MNGFLTLLSEGEGLTGAYAVGPEAGEWLQQATLAIRAHIPLPVLRDTIQPFPTFSEIFVATLKALIKEIKSRRTGEGGIVLSELALRAPTRSPDHLKCKKEDHDRKHKNDHGSAHGPS